MIGIAVGVIGLSLTDTCQLTLEEFNILYEEWDGYHTCLHRASWEQARFIAHCCLLPHTKKQLKPTDIVLFEWEKEKRESAIASATPEEFERVRKMYGGG